VAFIFTADRSHDIVLFVRSRHPPAKLVCSKCHGLQKEFPSGNLTYENTEIEEGSSVYLGSVVSENRETEEDVASRIKKENGVFVQLYPMWRNHNILKRVKI